MSATSTASTSASTIDIEAQRSIVGHHLPLPTPMRVVTHSPRAASGEFTIDPLDSFFGYTLSSSRSHESRHDRRISEVLPPYVEESNLPAYSAYEEPVTLAMYLFKFGFLFPPFWIFGAIILLSPLREPPTSSESVAWMPEKTEAERQQMIAEIRKVEVKWGRRCLCAILILSTVAIAAGLGIWAYLKR